MLDHEVTAPDGYTIRLPVPVAYVRVRRSASMQVQISNS